MTTIVVETRSAALNQPIDAIIPRSGDGDHPEDDPDLAEGEGEVFDLNLHAPRQSRLSSAPA